MTEQNPFRPLERTVPSESLNAMLAIEKGLYLASQGKTPDEATTAALKDLSMVEKGSLIIVLRPHLMIQVYGTDPELNDENRQWIEVQAQEALFEEVASV